MNTPAGDHKALILLREENLSRSPPGLLLPPGLTREDVIRPICQYVEQMFLLFGNGLYVKGADISGIRTAGPRLTAADVPEHLISEFPLPYDLSSPNQRLATTPANRSINFLSMRTYF